METPVKTNFSLPKWDAKKISGSFVTLAVLGGLGLIAYIYLLPFLLSLVWNTVQLAVGIIVGGFLLMTLLNPKFWRAMRYLSEAIAQYTLGFAIELNPFNILYLQVEEAEKDRQELYEQTELLKAQQSKLSTQLQERDNSMKIAARSIEIVKAKLQKTPTDEESQLQLEKVTSTFTNAKEFIDSVKPIANDIDKLVLFGDKAYRKSGIALEIAKDSITTKKATYDAVTTGANAMRKAMKAFAGNTDLNNDADKALEVLRNDVAKKIGVIKSAIQITSDAMNKQDLGDAAKVSLAADTAEQFNIDTQLEYSTTVTKTATGLNSAQTNTTGGNKFLNLLNDKK